MNNKQKVVINDLQMSARAGEGVCLVYAELPLKDGNSQSLYWVQAAATVIDSAIKMSEKKDFTKWQSEVSSQLLSILTGLAEIHQELRELRVWIDDRITEETRRQYHQRIDSVARDINRIIGAIGCQENLPTQGQRDDLQAHFRVLRITIDSLAAADGYAHIMGVVAGVIVALPLFTLLENRKIERSGWAAELYKYFEESIAISNIKSLEFARNTIASEYVSSKNEFDRYCNVPWKTNYEPARGIDPKIISDEVEKGRQSGRSDPVYIKQIAAGDINRGVSLAYRSGTEVGEGPPWYPALSAHWRIHSGPEMPWSEMYNDLEAKRQRSLYLGRQVTDLSEKIAQIRDIVKTLSTVLTITPG